MGISQMCIHLAARAGMEGDRALRAPWREDTSGMLTKRALGLGPLGRWGQCSGHSWSSGLGGVGCNTVVPTPGGPVSFPDWSDDWTHRQPDGSGGCCTTSQGTALRTWWSLFCSYPSLVLESCGTEKQGARCAPGKQALSAWDTGCLLPSQPLG